MSCARQLYACNTLSWQYVCSRSFWLIFYIVHYNDPSFVILTSPHFASPTPWHRIHSRMMICVSRECETWNHLCAHLINLSHPASILNGLVRRQILPSHHIDIVGIVRTIIDRPCSRKFGYILRFLCRNDIFCCVFFQLTFFIDLAVFPSIGHYKIFFLF